MSVSYGIVSGVSPVRESPVLQSTELNIIAIDTSTEACSAALLRDDGQVFAEFEIVPRGHTRLLPVMMDAVVGAAKIPKSSLTHCAFCNGPGAFTGIRIAAATAQGLAIGLGILLVPVSTLATLAQVSLDRHALPDTLVALDARMSEVYWAIYRRDNDGLARLEGSEKLDKLGNLLLEALPAGGAGHGWKAILENSSAASLNRNDMVIDTELLPDAKSLLKLAQQAVIEGRVVKPEDIQINYLRNQVAHKPRAR